MTLDFLLSTTLLITFIIFVGGIITVCLRMIFDKDDDLTSKILVIALLAAFIATILAGMID